MKKTRTVLAWICVLNLILIVAFLLANPVLADINYWAGFYGLANIASTSFMVFSMAVFGGMIFQKDKILTNWTGFNNLALFFWMVLVAISVLVYAGLFYFGLPIVLPPTLVQKILYGGVLILWPIVVGIDLKYKENNCTDYDMMTSD